MDNVGNYLEDARQAEGIFRNILRHLVSMHLAPIEVQDVERPLDEIFARYSRGTRLGKWTISDFRVGPYSDPLLSLAKNEAIIETQDMDTLSGYGRVDKYKICKDDSVEFEATPLCWRC